MTRRVKITLEFEADLDPVPGWGNKPEDWVGLLERNIPHQPHYNSTCKVLQVETVGEPSPAQRLMEVYDEQGT